MLKKSLALGVLAAFAMVPSAFANDQVQGNVTNTNIGASNVGVGNTTGISNSTDVFQNQSKYGSPFYGSGGNQVQGNGTNTGIGAGNVGYGNTTGITNNTNVNQNQHKGSGVYFPY
jgi:opacity protein-like surface antigen